MKLATLRAGGRDGTLTLVSRDLSRHLPQPGMTMQHLLDDWRQAAAALFNEYERLDADPTVGEPFDPTACHSPLPRAFHWVDGSAYVNHVELVRRARGAEMPASFWTDPLVYQGGSDDFTPPTDEIRVRDSSMGVDFEAEVAVIVDDVPMGAGEAAALAAIRLVTIVNDVSLRNLIPAELAKGFGFYQSKPATSFAPVAVTPDELGAAWRGGKLCGPLVSTLNGQVFGRPDAGEDMTFAFPKLIAHAARTRRLGAGAIVGSGTVSNRDGSSHGRPVAAGGRGYSCLAELRTVETIETGAPVTPFMADGDRIRIEMLDRAGRSLFGAIDQVVRIG